jgi:flavin reductase (DIM6/NTAB) family NADH-FMN oxidoreductase RutF
MVNEQTFKQVMAQWASGVSVVTTLDDDKWLGITVSSFSSVSLRPPLVSVWIANNLYSYEVIQKSGVFAVNILSASQTDMGMLFAGLKPEIEDRFEGLEIQQGETGCPILPHVMGWVDCRVWAAYPGGDHTIFVGEVLAAGVHAEPQEPVLYFNRRWGRFEAAT